MELEKNVLHIYKDNEDLLIKLITDCPQKSTAFKKTLRHLGAVTFLIEEDYVDKDYLDDYTNFYARCHRKYERFCKRLHFFKEESGFTFTTDVLNKIFTNGSNKDLIENIQLLYLGFIVLKPSKNEEQHIIGTTCLAHYKNDKDRNRYYTAIREYPVNLFGIPLSIKSMAFQEQDETVAMCASIAVWSAFSITGKKYQHRILSPSAVTNLALSESSYTRDYPNEGLTPEQMGVAMAKVHLKPLILRPKAISNRHIKGIIYAYSKAGIPVVCGISLYNEFKGNKGVEVGSKSFHAVTINGYSFEKGKCDISYKDELKLVSERMTQFYAHDDQLCPFTKMVFDENFTLIGKTLFHKIKTSWQSNSRVIDKTEKQSKYEEFKIAKVESLILPLYYKIRISYSDILIATQNFATEWNKIISGLVEVDLKEFSNFEWDIFLSEVSSFKKDVLDFPDFNQKEEILKSSFAKYLWRSQASIIRKDAKGHLNKIIIMELLFDATDSKKKGIPSYPIFYNKIAGIIFNAKKTKKII